MIVFPPCKINLGLRILHKRPDGFHALETLFYPIPFCDALEIIPAPEEDQAVTFTSSGLPITGDIKNNLCVKAYHALKAVYPQLPHIRLHLHKQIPMGAGLGGGSSDASYTLRLLDTLFALNVSETILQELALQLGSDCPFFLQNHPCTATGRGEYLTPVEMSLKGYQLMLINTGTHVHTGQAFSLLNRTPEYGTELPPLETLIHSPISNWKDALVNDFEAPVFQQHPHLAAIKSKLYEQGAVYAAMTGSGSSIFGLFDSKQQVNTQIWEAPLVKLLQL